MKHDVGRNRGIHGNARSDRDATEVEILEDGSFRARIRNGAVELQVEEVEGQA